MTFLILTYIFAMAAKKLNFYGEKRVKILVKNTKFRFLSKIRHFFRFFHRSSAKSRRIAKRPTVLNRYANDPHHF